MDIKKLKELGMLGNIRQRLGAEDENDTSMDERIMRMPLEKVVAVDSAWELGDEGWATNIINNYRALVLAEVTSLKKETEEGLVASSFDNKVNLDDAFTAVDKIFSACKD